MRRSIRVGISRRTFIRTAALAATGGLAAACGDEDGDDGTPNGDHDADAGADIGFSDVGDSPDADDAGADATADASPSDTNPSDAAHDVVDADAAPPVVAATVTFVHVNDLHGAFNPHPEHGSPAARLRGFYREVLAENPNTLFTNGGDDFEKGTVIEPMTGGAAVLELAKAMKFDVRCIGNHDFAWSTASVLEYSNDDVADVICSNVRYTGDEGVWGAQRFVIREVAGVRIGFFGMVGKPWNERNQQYDGNFYDDFPMDHDYAAVARAIVEEYRSQVDLLVMLSHLGYPFDISVANQVDGIDVILGAHTHSVLTNEFVANGAVIVQAGMSAMYVARLDVDFDASNRVIGFRYELFENEADALPLDDETQASIEEIYGRLAPDALLPIARLKNSLNGADVAGLAATAAVRVHGLDAALIDISTTWSSLSAGDLDRQQLVDVFKVERQPAGTPGFNSLYRTTMSGASLRTLQTLAPSAWRSVLPETIDDMATYAVGVQKHVAFNPTIYLPDDAVIGEIEPVDEMYAILAEYALSRSVDCWFVDVDETYDACGR